MLRKLLEEFKTQEELPIEVEELSGALVKIGAQDNIIFSGEDTDPGKVRGVFYQYTTSPGVYSPPELVTLIVYSNQVSPEWQRVICAKELVHICDSIIEKTNTEEEVSDLLDKLLGPLSDEDYGLADVMAARDKLALYQAIGLVFPMAARNVALEQFRAGEKTLQQIADWACIPENLVEFALDDEWPEILESLMNI